MGISGICSLYLEIGSRFLGGLKYPGRAYIIDKGRVLLEDALVRSSKLGRLGCVLRGLVLGRDLLLL